MCVSFTILFHILHYVTVLLFREVLIIFNKRKNAYGLLHSLIQDWSCQTICRFFGESHTIVFFCMWCTSHHWGDLAKPSAYYLSLFSASMNIETELLTSTGLFTARNWTTYVCGFMYVSFLTLFNQMIKILWDIFIVHT